MNQRDIERVNEPIPNVALLDAVMDRIEASPGDWNQETWGDLVFDYVNGGSEYNMDMEPCGTTHCFAGHAVELAGLAYVKAVKGEYINLDGVKQGYWQVQWVDLNNEKVSESIPILAKGALGLTDREVDRIFFKFTEDPLDLRILVEEVKMRGQRQKEAFDRIAKELIDSVPELEAFLKNPVCEEGREALLKALRDFGPKN